MDHPDRGSMKEWGSQSSSMAPAWTHTHSSYDVCTGQRDLSTPVNTAQNRLLWGHGGLTALLFTVLDRVAHLCPVFTCEQGIHD